MLKEIIRQIDEPEHAVLSLEVQAAMGPVVPPDRSQFELLVRHLVDGSSTMTWFRWRGRRRSGCYSLRL